MAEDWQRDLMKKVRNNIAETGWAVQMVMGDADQPTMAYTIGLEETFGHPEIFMSGFDPRMMHQLINVAGFQVKEGRRFEGPLLADRVIEKYDVAFRPLEPNRAGDVASVLYNHSGGAFSSVQMFLPDPAGRFPWEDGCDPAYAKVQTKLFETTGEVPSLRAADPGGSPTPH